MRKRFLSFIIALSLFTMLIPGNIAFAKSAPGGIKNNGLGGIYIDINSGSYQAYAPKSKASYGESGCTWFVSSRVNELTGKNVNIHSAENWKKYCSSYGFSMGSTPKAPAIICCTGGSYSHVAILEKIEGNTAYISEGGYRSAGAYHGCCIIRKDNVNSIAATYALPVWGGHTNITYIYFNGASGGGSTPVHTHNWSYANDSGHPHRQYRTCSGCGRKEYTGGTQRVAGCSSCYPIGNVSLTRSFTRTSKNVTFYRNNVSNANEYTLTLYKNGVQYNTYNMYCSPYTVSGLPSGEYSAKFTARNNSTGQSRYTYCNSFTLVDTYQVRFNANGGTNAPSAQTKIQNENLTITSAKPTRAHYIFKGWASNKTATEPQYEPGSSYTKNTPITLYAVWEPETYTIQFDMNGGMGTADSTTITYGDTMKMPNTVVRESYYLKGWSKNKNSTTADYRIGIDYALDENMTLYAVWANSTWGGTVASSFAGGDGTEQNPYQISNAGELAYLARTVNEQSSAPEYKYYILTDNINLGFREWKPIGLAYNAYQHFYGSFDGNGYTISDFTISEGNEGSIGLFGKAKDSEIKNLNIYGEISGMTLSNTAYIGAIVGNADNSDITGCNALYVNISDISNTATSYSYMGAICGYANGKISGCGASESSIAMKDGYLYTGVIAGYVKGSVTDCEVKASGRLFGSNTETDNLYLGGICGYLDGNAEKCIVKAGHYSNTLKAKQSYIGGVAGYSTGTINLCTAQFDNGSSKSIDGVSYPSSIYAEGSSTSRIGGITGYIAKGGKVTNCKYDGQSISSVNTAGTTDVGGIAGQIYGNEAPKISVQGGQSLSRAALPTRSGYTATWYTDANLTKEYDFSQPITGDITLYAKWTEGEKEIEIWDGTSEEPSYNAGTKTYTVTNGKELAWVSDVTNGIITEGANFPADKSFSGYTIELTNDIYLNDISNVANWETQAPANSWKPIGKDEDNSFAGAFDGNDYTINGLYMFSDSGLVGFFGYTVNSTIRNICTDNGYIYGTGIFAQEKGGMVGGISAFSKNCAYANCKNKLFVKNVDNSDERFSNSSAGGIIGYSTEDSISNCYNRGIVCGSIYSGGIVGCCNATSISHSANFADVRGEDGGLERGAFAGGICGTGGNYFNQRAIISYCYNKGYISVQCTSTSYPNVGGIIAILGHGEVSRCYNEGCIDGGNSVNNHVSIGGICGSFRSSDNPDSVITLCHEASHISEESKCSALYYGGIIGSFYEGTLSYCYHNGEIDTSAGTDVGGVIGYMFGSDPSHGTPSAKYCYCNMSKPVGKIWGPHATTTSVMYKSDASMKSISNLPGFSSTEWATNPSINGGYPYLKSLQDSYKTYDITVIKNMEESALLNKCFVNVDGILFSQSSNRASAGGAVGYAGLSSTVNVAPASNLLVKANKVSAKTTLSGYKAQAGKVIGSLNYNTLNFSNITSFDEMEVAAVNSANASNIEINNITGSEKQLSQITQARNLTQIFGPNTYQSLADLEEHPDAVWVVKGGSLPDLYYNLLRDIKISETENGTISVDKTQAVDEEIVTVTATPNEGYQLNKIYVNGEEITGSTFEVNGDSDVYATFIEETPEYNVRITATDNASASLVNVDAVNLNGFSLMSADDNITATDGDEIKVNTAADEEYTVDSIYVNGEELAGDSFILTEDSVVTMAVTSISTDVKATTGEATDIYGYYATLSGSVENGDGVSRYIRYWKTDAPDEVFTTEVQDGGGEYSVMVNDLSSDTEYSYQMCENGEIKTFTTMADSIYIGKSDDDSTEPTTEPTTEPITDPTASPTLEPTEEPIKRDMCFEIQNQSKGKFSVSADVVNKSDEAQSGIVILAAYDGDGKLLSAESEPITDLAANGTHPAEFAVVNGAVKYKFLVWDSWKTMLPVAASITIE